jgi:hypothetical protein
MRQAVLFIERQLLAQRTGAHRVGAVIDQHDEPSPAYGSGRYNADGVMETRFIAGGP